MRRGGSKRRGQTARSGAADQPVTETVSELKRVRSAVEQGRTVERGALQFAEVDLTAVAAGAWTAAHPGADIEAAVVKETKLWVLFRE